MKFKLFINSVFEYEQKVFILLFTFFTTGQLFSSIYIFLNKTKFDLNINLLNEQANTVVFKNLLALFIIFLLGYTVIGLPFICLSVLYSGVLIGAKISFFILCYGAKGCILSAVILFLYYFTFVISCMYISFSAIRLSVALYNLFKTETRYVSPRYYSRAHITKYIAFSLFTIIVSLYYCYIAQPIFNKILWKEV